MILILCGRCELPLAPDILLREAGVPFTRERVDLVAKRWRNGDYREITPKAYVPALRLEDGDILTECAVILSDIADQAPRQGLMPLAGSRARYHACAWLNFLATEVHGNFITPERHGGVAANFLANTRRASGGNPRAGGTAPGIYRPHAGRAPVPDRRVVGRARRRSFRYVHWALRIELDRAPWARLADYFAHIAAHPGGERGPRD